MAIAAGDYHNLALKDDGSVASWGLNTSDQLGTGLSTAQLTPLSVPGINVLRAVSEVTIAQPNPDTFAVGEVVTLELSIVPAGNRTVTNLAYFSDGFPLPVSDFPFSYLDAILPPATSETILPLQLIPDTWGDLNITAKSYDEENTPSFPSNPVTIHILPPIYAIATQQGPSSVLLQWTTPPSTSTSYRIERWLPGEIPMTVNTLPAPNSSSWLDSNLAFDPALLYRITGISGTTVVASSGDVPVFANSLEDLDGDGLPDSWEYANFGTRDYGANDDPDHDGTSNAGELIAGSNPNTRLLLATDLRVVVPEREVFGPLPDDPHDGNVELRWDAPSDARIAHYRVEWSQDHGPWAQIALSDPPTSSDPGLTCAKTGLLSRRAYSFRIVSVGPGGMEDAGPPVSYEVPLIRRIEVQTVYSATRFAGFWNRHEAVPTKYRNLEQSFTTRVIEYDEEQNITDDQTTVGEYLHTIDMASRNEWAGGSVTWGATGPEGGVESPTDVEEVEFNEHSPTIASPQFSLQSSNAYFEYGIHKAWHLVPAVYPEPGAAGATDSTLGGDYGGIDQTEFGPLFDWYWYEVDLDGWLAWNLGLIPELTAPGQSTRTLHDVETEYYPLPEGGDDLNKKKKETIKDGTITLSSPFTTQALIDLAIDNLQLFSPSWDGRFLDNASAPDLSNGNYHSGSDSYLRWGRFSGEQWPWSASYGYVPDKGFTNIAPSIIEMNVGHWHMLPGEIHPAPELEFTVARSQIRVVCNPPAIDSKVVLVHEFHPYGPTSTTSELIEFAIAHDQEFSDVKTIDPTDPLSLGGAEEGWHTLGHVPFEFQVLPDNVPGEETIVPADVGEVPILVRYDADPEESPTVVGVDVEWRVLEGSGGSLSQSEVSLYSDEPEGDSVLHTNTTAGNSYRVEAEVTAVKFGDLQDQEHPHWTGTTSIKEKTRLITVGPGEVQSIQMEIIGGEGPGSGPSMPADGFSERVIKATLTDAFGNKAAAGTQVSWRLRGDGYYLRQDTETNADGVATATLRAGRIRDLPQVVIVESDFKRIEYPIQNTPLNFSLDAGQLTQTDHTKSFTVSAAVTARDGTPIRWRTSRGGLVNAQGVVQAGHATATVVVTDDNPALFTGNVVVTAAVAKSTAIAAQDLGGITLGADVLTSTGPLLPGQYTAIAISASQLAGQRVQISTPDTGIQFSGLAADSTIEVTNGWATFTLTLPQAFNGESVSITVSPVIPNASVPATTLAIPVAQGPPGNNTVQSDLVALYAAVEYENWAAGPLEAAELARAAKGAYTEAAATNFAGPVAGLFPLEDGGPLDHQATQGQKTLSAAAKLNTAADKIRQLAAESEKLTVSDDQGRKLLQMDLADQVKGALGSAKPAATSWIARHLHPLADTLLRTKVKAFESFKVTFEAIKSTETWRQSQWIAEKLGNLPLCEDFKKLCNELTKEGLVEYLKAVSNFCGAIGSHPQAAAIVLFQEMEETIKGPLNSWAAARGDEERVAVAAAGLYAEMLQTGVLLATHLGEAGTNPVGSAKRMVSQLLGTILSAAFGSEEARTQLKEMVPFWSWLVMGEQIAEVWSAGDYYGAGKKACGLIIQAIGDITMLIPVVKGATLVLKMEGTLQTRLVQMLRKSTTGFARQTKAVTAGEADRAIIGAAEQVRCFPAGTLVLMGDGSQKPIETVHAGDLVIADDPNDDQPAQPRRVLDVMENWTQRLANVSLDANGDTILDAEIRATTEHPVWTVGRGWVGAGYLRKGDKVLRADGRSVQVLDVAVISHECATWNLTVEDAHSFFVVDHGVNMLVHNTLAGSRAGVIYRVKIGDKYYVGKASMPTVDPEFNPQDVLEYRFKNHHRMVRVDGQLRRISVHDAVVLGQPIYSEEGAFQIVNGKRVPTEFYKRLRGLEQLEWQRLNELNMGVSQNRPIRVGNPNEDEYIEAAYRHLLKIPCP